MRERRADRLGLTLAEVVVTLAILGAMTGLLLPVLLARRKAALARRCRSKMRQLFQGARMYQGNFDGYFPLAWHEGSGSSTAAEVSYGRFSVHMECDTSVSVRDATTSGLSRDRLVETTRFWADPAMGLTDYYFSPPAIFHLPAPDEMMKSFDNHADYLSLEARAPPTKMPFLAETYAAIPQEHGKGESRTGIVGGFKGDWFTVNGKSHDAFYGVARSWSEWDRVTNTGSGHERFDFRHNGAINVMFLDGHTDTIRKSDTARLRAVHEAWNIDSEGAP